ncbi:MAG: hypothetical protein DRI61_00335 [Chloroflexi bacterium]|nr:MAG: hypothetical protein DRI61_00335 [Chloroflexota bacterium]
MLWRKNSLKKKELEEMYLYEGLSIRQIADRTGLTRGQVEHLLEKYKIPRRTVAEAMKLKAAREKEEKIQEARFILEETLKQLHVSRRKIKPIVRRNLLVPLRNSSNKDCTVTLVISDLHIGDANHLPDTYWSTISNVKEVLKVIKRQYDIKAFYLVLNGDLVSGRDVYKFQELRNLLERGHWQVFMAEYVIKRTLKELEPLCKVTTVYLTKGTHENLANNFVLYLKRMLGPKTYYLSHGGIVNIAKPLGEYNVFFTHGMSYSEYFPIPPRLMRDCINSISKYRSKNIYIDRVCTSHTHWLTSSVLVGDIYWDVTGGFQKWEHTIFQRPCGVIMYLYNNGECVSIPVRPDPKIEEQEKNDVGLEYKNLKYYGEYLLSHLKEVERR